MAITSAQQSAVFKLAVGLFNAAPGGFYNSVAGILLSSKDAAAAADALIATDAFQAIIPSNLLTNDQFAARLVQNLVGDTATQANKDWAAAAILGQLNSGKTLGEAAWWAIDALSNVSTSDANWGAAAATLLNKIAVAQHFTVESPVTSQNLATLQGLLIDVTSDAGTVAVAKAALSNNINLSTTVETTNGTSGADTFKAFLANGANTLQSGDVIRGGAGSDTLLADITTGTSAENAIAIETSSVETIKLRSQHSANTNNNGNNNLQNAEVTVDAERAANVGTWHNYNSRADLIIEDVRIADGLKTSQVPLVMESTDPGNVDFGVYFDQHSLRNSSTGNTTLTIRLMDTGAAGAAATAATPLLNNPYDQFKLGINGVLTTIQLDKTAVAAADTYEALLTVFQNALASTAGVSVSLGQPFSVTDPISNTTVTGKEIVLTGSQGIQISAPQNSGWYNTTGASVPPTSNIYTTYGTSASSVTELVTATIVLDDVGRGSTGGDLVVGGMSVGATSTSRGVERFEIEVRDNSKLQTINSTNDSLREVTIKNGVTTNTDLNQGAYDKTATNAGNLTVNGNANPTNAVQGQVAAGNSSDTKLPGLDDAHHGAYGFTDVRLIDGSAMTGKLAFTAQITANTINKYINLVDTQSNPAGDVAGSGNVNFNQKGANFDYRGGANNDTIKVDIDAAAASSRSKIVTGQSDFTFNVDGGAGDDAITVKVANLAGSQSSVQSWYANQNLNNNITINAGTGNDTIRIPGAGDVTINAGDGDDAVFSDNTGAQGSLSLDATKHLLSNPGVSTTTSNAAWVYNTALQNGGVASMQDVQDLRSDVNNSYNLYKAKLQVSFKGLASQQITLQNSDTYTVSDLEINQAIKNAINTDSILSKLLVAKDGPANSLVIESLIDGVMNGVAEVPSVTITAPAAADLNSSEVQAMATKWGVIASQVASATAADAVTFMQTGGGATFSGAGADGSKSLAAFATKADYVADEATDGATQIVGADSTAVSDNFITPGAGNDLVVLGTTVGANVDTSSNEVVVYSGSFGNDTIVNFAVAGNGIDHIDFSSYLGGSASGIGAAPSTDDRRVQILDVVTTGGTANDTAEKIKALYDAQDQAVAGTTVKQVYITLDTATHNVGTVYSVVDGSADNDTQVTKVGTIDLADVDWHTLTTANFTVPSVTAEGPSVAISTVTVAGAAGLSAGTYTLSDTAANLAAAAAAVGNGATNITATTAATVLEATAIDAFTNSGTNSFSLSDTAANLAAAAAAVGNGATNITATTAATVAQATAIDAFNNTGANSYAVADVFSAANGQNFTTGFAGNTGVTLTGDAGAHSATLSAAADVVIINSAVGADADTIGGFTIGQDDLNFNVAGLGLNGADYAVGAVTVINAAAAAALGAGAWNNHIVVDTAANIGTLVIGGGSATGAVLAIASNTGAISYDADGDFTGGAILIGTVTGGGAFTAADLVLG